MLRFFFTRALLPPTTTRIETRVDDPTARFVFKRTTCVYV